MRALYNDGRVEECEDELKVLRHTAAHVLAQAVKRLFPETKLAIGPAIEDGFYYDFDREGGFSEEDLAAIEAEMKRIVKENLKVETYALTREEALEYLEGDPHVWVSPGCARVMARNLATALAELLPQKRQEIQAKLARLNLEIDALDAELRLVTKDRQGERFYVFHPAWSYLAREYGLQQVAVEQEGR